MQTPIKDGESIEHEEIAPAPSVNMSLFSHLEATDPEPQGRAVREDEFDHSDWGSQIDEAPDARDIGHEVRLTKFQVVEFRIFDICLCLSRWCSRRLRVSHRCLPLPFHPMSCTPPLLVRVPAGWTRNCSAGLTPSS
jgi:hypothetical protein